MYQLPDQAIRTLTQQAFNSNYVTRFLLWRQTNLSCPRNSRFIPRNARFMPKNRIQTANKTKAFYMKLINFAYFKK